MSKLIDDISALTSISQNALCSLLETSVTCIGHDVYENIISKNSLTEIDIGIGTLYIKLEEEIIKYKFIPSKKLEECVESTVLNKTSPIVDAVEYSLKERVESTYKNLL